MALFSTYNIQSNIPTKENGLYFFNIIKYNFNMMSSFGEKLPDVIRI